MPNRLDFSHLPPELKEIKRVNGGLPRNTPIEALGLSKEGTAHLTLAAAKLTKADLEDLGTDPEGTQRRLCLSVDDINSVVAAFTEPMQISRDTTKGWSISCCTPCCCAVAVLVEQAVC
jgi:hypothetical protein